VLTVCLKLSFDTVREILLLVSLTINTRIHKKDKMSQLMYNVNWHISFYYHHQRAVYVITAVCLSVCLSADTFSREEIQYTCDMLGGGHYGHMSAAANINFTGEGLHAFHLQNNFFSITPVFHAVLNIFANFSLSNTCI